MAYGYGTKSHLNSTENRRMKRERAEFTAKYEAGEIELKRVDPRDFMVCRCLSFANPHTLNAHEKLKADHDWRTAEQREREAISEYHEWKTIR
jgi:hypothetical protein